MSDQSDKPMEDQKKKSEQEQAIGKQPLEGVVSCDTCLKEIPQSISHTEEGEDYVLYFCGLECYDKWRRQGE